MIGGPLEVRPVKSPTLLAAAFHKLEPKPACRLPTQILPFPTERGQPKNCRTAFRQGHDAPARVNVLVWVESGRAAFGVHNMQSDRRLDMVGSCFINAILPEPSR
jgi:hypothetical protein